MYCCSVRADLSKCSTFQFKKPSAVSLPKRRHAASAEAFGGAWLTAPKLPPPRLLTSSP